ncbi:MAG: dienelactone hydrolase family protein [Pseudomonadota bacterium]
MKNSQSILLIVTLLLATSLCADVVTKHIDYQVDGAQLQGYLATPEGLVKPTPGILVVHEWWGHNEYARRRAEMLAELGYIAFSLDMYGDNKVADHPDDAKKYMQEATRDPKILIDRFNAALDLLKQQNHIDPDNIAAIGYCFGGAVVLNMARAGSEIQAVVSFHGALATQNPAVKDEVKAKVLVLHGGNDALVPEDQVEAFEKEMKAANVDYELVTYDGVDHSFTNPGADEIGEKYSLPVSYDKEADENSWQHMKDFLKEVFSSSKD